ncbi:MAG: FG-GAP-like repeat-containing protein [Kofleriaceae bacterium]
MIRASIVLALLSTTSSVRADTESLDVIPPEVTLMPAKPFVGAGQHRVALAVPAWHGLEPQLVIAYASSMKNGWVGVGMTLEGLSTIERVSPNLGAPTYTSADTYQLDGEPMIACAAGSTSPSCMTGGTHTTKHERYVRIVKSGTSWTVTSPTGVIDRYTTLAEPIAVLSSRTDTSGNAVTYTHTTSNGTSYPSSIAYNGTTITFAYEGRTDVLGIGTGTGLRRIDKRLVAIAVRTDGAVHRAYRLSYTTGGAGRSYLASAQEYGGDAVLNGAGAVTGGTALPATRFAYAPDRPAIGATSSGVIVRPTGSTDDETLVADVNGDGRGDAVAIARYSSGGVGGNNSGTLSLVVQLGRADGAFAPQSMRSTTTSNPNIGWYDEVRSGDVNGDGKADLVIVQRSSVYRCCGAAPVGYVDVQLALGTATGTFTFPAVRRISSEGESDQFDKVLLADLNGDGRSDLVLARSNPLNGNYGNVDALISLSNGTTLATATRRTLLSGGVFASIRIHAGDTDGDGRDDLVVVLRGSRICGSASSPDVARANTYLSLGDGTFGPRISSTLNAGCVADSYAGDALVDVNGDGLADLVGDEAYSIFGAICSDCDSDVKIVANLGNGNGTFGGPLSSIGWSGANAWIGNFTAGFVDINGDGVPDRVAAQGGTSLRVLVSYGRGDGYFESGIINSVATGGSTSWANSGAIGFGDVDGDGRLSIVLTHCIGVNFHVVTLAPSAQFSGLLQTVTLPTGGSVGLTYTTSSSFPNGYLPFAFPVLANSRILDGRGQTSTTTYSYTGGLYVPAERRFFGFATSRVTDGGGAIRDLAFTQHVADPPGTIATTHVRTNAALVSYHSTTFARSGNGTTVPYVSNPSRRYDYECNGLPTCKSASRGWTYSAYGAVASEIEYGDDAITGDERTTFRTQVVNPTAFITQRDATTTVRAGAANPAGTQLAYTELAYDNAVSATTAPTRGLVTKRSRWRGGSSYVVERLQYDTGGNETEMIDPLGNTTTKSYDARHRLVGTVNPLGHAVTQTYDTLGRVATITNENGGITNHTYDVFGRAIRRVGPDGSVATAAFANWGNPTTQFVTTAIADGSPDGLWKQTYLDGLGRTVRVVEEGGITTDTTYNLRGLVSARSAPYQSGGTPVWTTTTYDALRRPRVVTEPDGAATTMTYGNWTVSTTDHRGLVTDRFYDAYKQLVQVIEKLPVAQTTTIGYDLLGRRVQVVDAKGNTTITAYDLLGRRTQSQDPDLGVWQYTYDDAGRVTSQRDARGVVIDLTYDAIGRPLQRREGTTTHAAFTYDEVAVGSSNIGWLTSFTDLTGSTRRHYDAAGRLHKESKTIGATTYLVDWSYDAVGRLSSTRYPAVGGVREQVTLTYDARGRVASVGGYVSGLAYDARSNLTAATYGNGATVARTYSPTRGWMLGQTVNAGGVVRDQFAVTRTGSGDITGRTSTSEVRDAWQFVYDPLGRLTSANNTADDTLDEAFTYDPIGARLTARRGAATTTYQYPAGGVARPHAPTSIGGVTVRYDANGNRLGIGASDDATYDANNRLVDDGTTTYAYDAEGTRVRAGTKVFVRDLFEADGTSSMSYYYLGRERVARRDQTGAVAYYHGDSIGTVRTLTSNTAAVAGRKLAFAFGELASASGIEDPFGIAGQRRDDSGLYHMGARMMDPAHGQFTQPDPSGAPDPARPQTLNRYSYVLNNPIRLADPTGFQEEEEKEKEKNDEEEEELSPDDKERNPLRIVILEDTPERLKWRQEHRTFVAEAPRLFSKEFYEQPGVKAGTEPEPGTGIRWGFKSSTGRIYGDRDAYSGEAFETMDEAIDYADESREGTFPDAPYDSRGILRFNGDFNPAYLESDTGSTLRYNVDQTIDVIRPQDVPADATLLIFREALTS